MTDTQAEAPEQVAEAPEQAAAESGSALDRLEAKVDKLAEAVAGLLKGGGGTKAEQEEATSVGAEVRKELARLKEAEARKAAKDGESKRVADLEAKVKKIAEKPPKEYRKITSWLWGGDE